MTPNENIFSAITRFEQYLSENGIPKFKWYGLLPYLLVGRHLDNYRAHSKSCIGDFDAMKTHLILSGGFNRTDCWNTVTHKFRPNGTLSVDQWIQQQAYKVYVLFKTCSEADKIDEETLYDLFCCLTTHIAIATLHPEGHAFVMNRTECDMASRIRAFNEYARNPNLDKCFLANHHSDYYYMVHVTQTSLLIAMILNHLQSIILAVILTLISLVQVNLSNKNQFTTSARNQDT